MSDCEGTRPSQAAREGDQNVADDVLVKRLVDRDEGAFHEIYDRYFTLVLAISDRICRQRADAQAVVSVVFMEIWNYPNRFRPTSGSFRTYIGLLARSRAMDHVRRTTTRRSNHQRAAIELGTNTDVLQNRLDPATQSADAELSVRVRETLNSLPSDLTTVLAKSFYDGLSHREIADELNLPLGTVKSKIRRALKLLASRIRATKDLQTEN